MFFYSVFDKSTNKFKYVMVAESNNACLENEFAIEITESDYNKLVFSKDISQIFYKNNEIHFFNEEDQLENKKNIAIKKIKEIGNQLIRTFNGKIYSQEEWILKSQNYQDCKANYSIMMFSNIIPSAEQTKIYKNACDMITRKDKYVDRINEIEKSIIEMPTQEIDFFDPFCKSHWDGIDTIESENNG